MTAFVLDGMLVNAALSNDIVAEHPEFWWCDFVSWTISFATN